MKQSAGTLLYRDGPDGLEVLLVHPSGWYNRGKPWSIPKGLPDPDERPGRHRPPRDAQRRPASRWRAS